MLSLPPFLPWQVIATPFGTSFDHLRIADEVQYKFDRCCKALQAEMSRLPVYGVGHSLGSLLHLLISARYAVEREGNALMAFNNRPATDSIPFLSPLLAPSARAVGPLLAQLAASPFR
jgi:alpha-beta hydrolase superfamily lysophospholipase